MGNMGGGGVGALAMGPSLLDKRQLQHFSLVPSTQSAERYCC